MFINVHLIGYIDHLFSDIFVVLEYVFVLRIKFETFILKVISFLDYCFELLGDGIIYKFVLNVFFQVMK
jgi:hypothetical protein